MTRAGLLWVVFSGFALAAGPDLRSPSAQCDDEAASCKESCTLDYGSSFRTRAKLGQCLQRCEDRSSTCLERHFEMERNHVDPGATDHDQGARDDLRHADSDPARPAPPKPDPEPESAPAPDDPALSGRTRASDLPPPIDDTPESYDAPAAKPKPKPEAAQPPPPPPAARAQKTAEAPQPAPPKPPEKKRDVSEWDPGDIQ